MVIIPKTYMDGYKGSSDIQERLEYALAPCVDLYHGEMMEMLRDSLEEIKKLRKEPCDHCAMVESLNNS